MGKKKKNRRKNREGSIVGKWNVVKIRYALCAFLV